MTRSIARIVLHKAPGHFTLRQDRTIRANGDFTSPPRNGEVSEIIQHELGFDLVIATGPGKGVLFVPYSGVEYAFVTGEVAAQSQQAPATETITKRKSKVTTA